STTPAPTVRLGERSPRLRSIKRPNADRCSATRKSCPLLRSRTRRDCVDGGRFVVNSRFGQVGLVHRRFGLALGLMALLVGWSDTGTTSAQRCTVGVDLAPSQDRYPSACARYTLPDGLRAVGPTAAGPGNAVT